MGYYFKDIVMQDHRKLDFSLTFFSIILLQPYVSSSRDREYPAMPFMGHYNKDLLTFALNFRLSSFTEFVKVVRLIHFKLFQYLDNLWNLIKHRVAITMHNVGEVYW